MSSQDLPEKELNQRLQALKQSMEGVGAPPRVEAAVLAAFRSRQTRPQTLWWPRWALAAAAALVVVVGLAVLTREGAPPQQAVVMPPVQPAIAPPPVIQSFVAAPKAPRAARSRAAAARTTVEFIPLVPDRTLGWGDTAQIMRVSLPRTALQSLGLPVDEDRAFETVQADLIVGHDMVARAIRIVR